MFHSRQGVAFQFYSASAEINYTRKKDENKHKKMSSTLKKNQ